MKMFVIDKAKCVGCHNCQIACKDEHCGNDWMPIAKPQPKTGHFWMRVDETVHGQVPKVRVEHTPTSCQHCANCAIEQAYPGSIVRREDGLTYIDPAADVDMKALASVCPAHAVFYNAELGIAQKCTGCAHLVDAGEVPHCVDVCAVGALRFGDEQDFAEELAEAREQGRASELAAVKGRAPRVCYLNDPKLFIAGEVWDPAANEIIENATVALYGGGQEIAKTQTDEFGDFWFERLDAGTYAVRVTAEGFEPDGREGIDLEKSLNIGDFALVACGK